MKEKYRIERSRLINRSQISNNDYNPNKTTPRQQEAIAQSLKNYGQLTAILVRPDPDREESYIIVDGEHRSMVLEEQVYVDVVHDLSDADAKKLTVIMNETRGSADKIDLAQLLASIEKDFDDFAQLQSGLPYDDTELQELIDLADVDWDNFETTSGDGDTQDKDLDDDWVTITCRLPEETLDVINQAIALIKDETDLHKDKAIANGQVLEILCANYLALPHN